MRVVQGVIVEAVVPGHVNRLQHGLEARHRLTDPPEKQDFRQQQAQKGRIDSSVCRSVCWGNRAWAISRQRAGPATPPAAGPEHSWYSAAARSGIFDASTYRGGQ